MRIYKTLACPFEVVYHLISDIESYPSFLPHIHSAQILEKPSDTQLKTRVSFKWLGRLYDYQSEVDLLPQQVVARSDISLGAFQAIWTLFALTASTTHITFELKGGAWLRLVPRAVVEQIIQAFEKRALDTA